jgi:hypothetical protein
MRVLIEVLHLALGIAAAAAIAYLAEWSYPLAGADIWRVAGAAIVAVLLMGVGPLRRAYAEDRAILDAERANPDG